MIRCHKEVEFVGVHGEENWRFEIIQFQLVTIKEKILSWDGKS